MHEIYILAAIHSREEFRFEVALYGSTHVRHLDILGRNETPDAGIEQTDAVGIAPPGWRHITCILRICPTRGGADGVRRPPDRPAQVLHRLGRIATPGSTRSAARITPASAVTQNSAPRRRKAFSTERGVAHPVVHNRYHRIILFLVSPLLFASSITVYHSILHSVYKPMLIVAGLITTPLLDGSSPLNTSRARPSSRRARSALNTLDHVVVVLATGLPMQVAAHGRTQRLESG